MTAEEDHSSEERFAVRDEPLVSVSEAALDRMPALTLIFEESASRATRAFAAYTEIPVDFYLERLEVSRLLDLAGADDEGRPIFVFRAIGLDANIAAAMDDAMWRVVIEVLLGSGMVDHATDRRPTKLEKRLAEFAVGRFLKELAEALSSLTLVAFERDPLAEESGLGALGQKTEVVISAVIGFQALERQGRLSVLMPRSALDPFATALARMPGAEGKARDEHWSERLYEQIVRTEVRIDLKLEARGLTLGEISRLAVGDVLRLPVAPDGLIRVTSEDATLFWCTLGQKDGFYTVRIEEFSDERQSFIENILGV